jgi:hypothetical protein
MRPGGYPAELAKADVCLHGLAGQAVTNELGAGPAAGQAARDQRALMWAEHFTGS